MIVALRSQSPARPLRFALPALAAVSAAGLASIVNAQAGSGRTRLDEARNFYGEVAVVERAADDPAEHDLALFSGSILHGVQFVAEEKRDWPTAYYGEESGVGRLLSQAEGRGPVRVGTIGLGVGTLAAYARPGDEYRFYEINPEM